MFYNSNDIYLQRYFALPRRHCAGLVGISQLLVPLGQLDQQQKKIFLISHMLREQGLTLTGALENYLDRKGS